MSLARVARMRADDGYRISFGTAKPPGGKFFAQGYKADLHPPVGRFGAVSIPFTNFTDVRPEARDRRAPQMAVLRRDALESRARSSGTTRRVRPSTRAPRRRSTAPTRRR